MELLTKLKFPTLLLAAGLLMTATSVLTGLNLKSPNLAVRESVSVPVLMIGAILIALAVVLFIAQEGLLSWAGFSPVRRIGKSPSVGIGRSRVTVHFGRLEAVVGLPGEHENPVVLLPTNEFFDEDCFKATGTACGGYLRAKAGTHFDELRDQILGLLTKLTPTGEVEKELDKKAPSYGPGTVLLVEHPFGLSHAILLAAVATKRQGIGFRSNPGHIFRCLERAAEIAIDQRYSSIYMPLIGAGKGGLSPETSLMMILLSISDLQRRLGGFDSGVHIVIFQPEPGVRTVVSKRSVERILSLAASMHRQEYEPA